MACSDRLVLTRTVLLAVVLLAACSVPGNPGTFLAWLERLPPRYLINRLPTRLLDSLIAIRANGPDTC